MPPANAPGILQVFIRGQIVSTAQWENQFFLQKGVTTTPWSQADSDDACEFMEDEYDALFMPTASVNVSHLTTHAIDLTSNMGVVSDSSPAGVVGGATGDTLPWGTASLISWKIARRYRGGHPRTYLPPTGEPQSTTGQQYIGTYVTALQTAATNLIHDVNIHVLPGGDTLRLVTIHRHVGGVQLAVPLVDPILSGVASAFIVSQRGRYR